MAPVSTLPTLLAAAWLIPLASFVLILFFGPRMGKAGKYAGYLATAAIGTSCAISLFALLLVWLPANGVPEPEHHASADHGHEAAGAEARKRPITRRPPMMSLLLPNSPTRKRRMAMP